MVAIGLSSCANSASSQGLSTADTPATSSAASVSSSPGPLQGLTPSSEPSTTTSPTTTAAQTVVKTFNPFKPGTATPAIQIDSTRTGYCWTGSIAVGTTNAYRCMAHNLILDPCFAPKGSRVTSVVCVAAPWDAGTDLHLSRPLPSDHNTGTMRSGWAMRLANGRECVAVTGTIQFVDDVPMRYACDQGKAGNLLQNGGQWTVAYLPPHATATSPVAVSTLWR